MYANRFVVIDVTTTHVTGTGTGKSSDLMKAISVSQLKGFRFHCLLLSHPLFFLTVSFLVISKRWRDVQPSVTLVKE